MILEYNSAALLNSFIKVFYCFSRPGKSVSDFNLRIIEFNF